MTTYDCGYIEKIIMQNETFTKTQSVAAILFAALQQAIEGGKILVISYEDAKNMVDGSYKIQDIASVRKLFFSFSRSFPYFFAAFFPVFTRLPAIFLGAFLGANFGAEFTNVRKLTLRTLLFFIFLSKKKPETLIL